MSPDRQPIFQIAYLPLEFAGKPKSEQESAGRELFEKHGEKPRLFKNGIGIAVPTADQVEGLVVPFVIFSLPNVCLKRQGS